MSEHVIPDALLDALPLHTYTVLNGRDLVSDPGLAQLRRYLPVLAVIAAPYAGLGGDQEVPNPLDPAAEWQQIVDILTAATRQQPEGTTPLAVARLLPPTTARLEQALAINGPDAFPIVHLVCHGERDMLYLEDENGHESYTVPEHLVRLFKPGQVRLVFLDGCFSRRVAQMLLDETSVEAVIGTRRRVNRENEIPFAARFYAAISQGIPVRQAFRGALAALRGPDNQADRYEVMTRDDDLPITLPLPAPKQRASRPLLADGQPRQIGIPLPLGFTGRRDLLAALAQDIPGSGRRIAVIHGAAGTGKSWAAAEFVARFGWRFPGGVLWWQASSPTTFAEIAAQIARLLELPLYTPPEQLARETSRHAVLLVLDQADEMAPAELVHLRAWVESFDPQSGSRVILIGQHIPEPLAPLEDRLDYELSAFSPKEARTLAMRLAVERRLDALDVDTIDDFLERTHHLPWLIAKGVELIESDGLAYALDDLSGFQPDMPDPLGLYLSRRLKLLEKEPNNPLGLLNRVQDLPDAFDAGLIRALGGDQALRHVQTLVKHSLLRREGPLYVIPRAAAALARRHVPLRPEQQGPRDKFLINYLIKTWPDDEETSPYAFTREQQARLNHVRALLRRQLDPAHQFDPVLLARLLIKTAPSFCAAGLAREFVDIARALRQRLPDGEDLARLQIRMGEALNALSDAQEEAGYLLQMTLAMPGLDMGTVAEASRAYGHYLRRDGQLDSAQRVIWQGLQALIPNPDAHVLLASSLAADWAQVLLAAGKPADAVSRFEAALAGYAQAERPDRSAATQCALSEALIELGDLDRAEDSLRRALMTAEYGGQRELAGQVRCRLGRVLTLRAEHVARRSQPDEEQAEWRAAVEQWQDALADLLPYPDSVRLAGIYLALGQAQARLQQLDDAAANVARACWFYQWSGQRRALAEASVILGQVCLAKGDSVAAQAALHEALDLARLLADRAIMTRAAGVLVRLHQIRARHAHRADPPFRRNTRDQAMFTREHLASLGLDEYVAALDHLIRALP